MSDSSFISAHRARVIWLQGKRKKRRRFIKYKQTAGQSKVTYRPRSTPHQPCPFGDYMQYLRVCLGWSQQTAARELYRGLQTRGRKEPRSHRLLTWIEKEERFPNFAMQRRILKLYRPDPAEFYARLNKARMRKGLGPIVPISELKEWQEKVSSVLWLRAKLKESALQAKKMVVVKVLKGEETVFEKL